MVMHKCSTSRIHRMKFQASILLWLPGKSPLGSQLVTVILLSGLFLVVAATGYCQVGSPYAPLPQADRTVAKMAPAIGAAEANRTPVALIRVPLSVRWRDLDAFNHVNNSKYLSYLEEARLRWMLGVPGQGLDDHVAPVVAAANLNYRRPIEWPAEVDIELFVERLGNTSVSIGHRIVDAKDDPHVEARLNEALQQAKSGLHAKTLQDARASAQQVFNLLQRS